MRCGCARNLHTKSQPKSRRSPSGDTFRERESRWSLDSGTAVGVAKKNNARRKTTRALPHGGAEAGVQPQTRSGIAASTSMNRRSDALDHQPNPAFTQPTWLERSQHPTPDSASPRGEGAHDPTHNEVPPPAIGGPAKMAWARSPSHALHERPSPFRQRSCQGSAPCVKATHLASRQRAMTVSTSSLCGCQGQVRAHAIAPDAELRPHLLTNILVSHHAHHNTSSRSRA